MSVVATSGTRSAPSRASWKLRACPTAATSSRPSGVERLRVRRWLPDDPYPRAEIEVIAEPKRAPARATEQRVAVERLLKRVLALWAELGQRAPNVDAVQLDPDPLLASFEASAMAPIGPLDAQRLIELDDPCDRFEQLEALLNDEIELLQMRLAQG
jgi:Lon protease-like protein